jgi:hypothetical protein
MTRNRFLKAAAGASLVLLSLSGTGARATDQRSSSGSPRPLMPGNQPAGTSLHQATPGSSMGPATQKPATPPPPPATSVPSPTPGNSNGAGAGAGVVGQGTVKGSKAAPDFGTTLPGGTAGSRGNKDGVGGR